MSQKIRKLVGSRDKVIATTSRLTFWTTLYTSKTFRPAFLLPDTPRQATARKAMSTRCEHANQQQRYHYLALVAKIAMRDCLPVKLNGSTYKSPYLVYGNRHATMAPWFDSSRRRLIQTYLVSVCQP